MVKLIEFCVATRVVPVTVVIYGFYDASSEVKVKNS